MHLRRINISNFRIFPAGFSLELAYPGVTILVGQNGLGKSSFFEAIEWGLTGKVERLQALPSGDVQNSKLKELVYAWITENKVSQSIDVELIFEDRGSERRLRRRWELDRSKKTFRKVMEPNEGDVLSLLVNESWALPVTDVGSYLLQTHILSQSDQARFIARDPKDRWNGIVGPIGFERLSRAQKALTGGTTRSLSQKYAEQEQQLEQAKAKRAEWQQLLRDRDDNRTRLAGVDGVSDELIQQQLLEMNSEIAKALGTLGSDWATAPIVSPGDIEEGLAFVEGAYAKRHEALEGVREAPHELANASDRVREREQEWVSAQRAQQALLQQHQALQEKLQAAEERLNSAQTRRQGALGRWTSIRQVVERLQQLDDVRSSLARTADNFEQLKARHTEAKSSLDEVSDTVRARERQISIRRDTERRITALQNLQQTVIKFFEERGKESSREVELQQARDQLSNLRQRAQQVAEQISQWNTRLRAIEVEERALRNKLGAMERAVAEVAALIADDHDNCPLCGTHFPAAAELRARVMSRVSLGDTELAPLQGERERASASLSDVTRLSEELHREVSAVEQLLARLRSASEAFTGLRERLSGEETLAAISEDAWPETITLELRALEDILAQQPATVDVNDLRRQANEKIAELQALEEDIALAVKRREATVLQLAETEQFLKAHETITAQVRAGDAPSLLDEAAQTSGDAQEEENQASAELSTLRTEQLRSETQCAEATARVKRSKDTFDAAVNEAAAREASIKARWAAAGCTGPVAAEGIVRSAERLREVSIALNGLRQQRQQIRQWIEIRRTIQTRDMTESRVNKFIEEFKQTGEADVTAALDAHVGEEQRRLEQVKRAGDLANKLADLLRHATEEYVRETLGPLNELSDRFHLAFSTFPERQVTINPHTDNRQGTSLRAGVRLHRASSDEDAFPARHILSEGQLSETSLSLLFAMSSGYRWSRWRALLLDDPLQHNDIVHGAAFIDVVRNMARDPSQRYQFIISTHDLDLAEFFQRKLIAGKVPCVIYRYVRPGFVESYGR